MLGAVNAQTLADLQQSSFDRAGKATSSSYPPERRMSGEVLHTTTSGMRPPSPTRQCWKKRYLATMATSLSLGLRRECPLHLQTTQNVPEK
jgi:hypothetical protein